jgi:ATP-dependent Clp protease ATP-binding subunit ClpB
MRVDRFTQHMQEALQAAQSLAANRNHTEFDNKHFLLSLLEQPDGVTLPRPTREIREEQI